MDVTSPLLRPPLLLSRRILGGVVGLSLLLLCGLGYAAYRLLTLTPDTTQRSSALTDAMLLPRDDRMLPVLRAELDHRKIELVEQRLELLALVADAYLAEKPSVAAVSMSELMAWKPRLTNLAPVEGESYDDLVFVRGWSVVSVRLAAGLVVEYSKPPSLPPPAGW